MPRQPELLEVGTHGFGRDTRVAQVCERRGTVALRELRPVLAEEEAVVDVLRSRAAERSDERRLQLRIRPVVGAADDVRDPEVEVVDRRCELVGRRAVRAQQGDPAEAERALGVGLTDLVRRLPVAHEPLALAERPLVPGHAEPFEVGDDRLRPSLDVPRGVRVVDPQQERASVLVGEAAVRDGAQRAPQVQRARRARGEANPRHGSGLLAWRRVARVEVTRELREQALELPALVGVERLEKLLLDALRRRCASHRGPACRRR